MHPKPKLDLAEATRLTRAGRLGEAMAVLRGLAPRAGTPSRGAPTLDMTPPAAGSGRAWTAPGTGAPGPSAGSGDGSGEALAKGLAGVELPEALRRFLDRAGTPGPMPGPMPGAMPDLHGLVPGTSPLHPLEPLPEGASFETFTYANEAGSRAYKLYVPGGHKGKTLPLIVMLHGCTQSPDDFAAGTRMNALAEEEGFLVAYPAQARTANAQKCWNWFEPGHQGREGGEPSIIAGLTRRIMAEHPVDPSRVYVAGLSAGGAAAAVMAATHPDLYAAAGVHSGLACGVARDMPSALAAMRQGPAGPPARTARGRPVPTIVFHGDRDAVVHPTNGEVVIAGGRSAGLSPRIVLGRSPGGIAYTQTVEVNRDGRPILEHWVLHEAGHAWSGGSPAGSYTEPRGPDASREMLRFFAHHALPPG